MTLTIAILSAALQQAASDASPLAIAIGAAAVIVAMVGIAIASSKDNPSW